MTASNILGLHPHNFVSEGEKLIAVWEKTPMVYNGSGWIRGATLTDNKDAYMASFIDKVFLVNDTDNNFEYNGTYWTSNENAKGSPIAKFIFPLSTRLFLFNIQILGTRYASKCWYSDLPNNNTLTWGLESGTDLVQTAGSAVVTSASSFFKDRNIKVADPLFILSGANKRNKFFTVQSVDSDTQITLTEDMTATDTGSFWLGSNWFDVETDDGDMGNGLGSASNELILYKKNSVSRYNVEGQALRRIKDIPGTTSPRSIVSWGGYSYWYHPSGIYRTGGGLGENISAPIEDMIDGVADVSQTLVVGFVDQIRNEVGMYLGDITLRDGETITDCAVVLDLDSNIWTPRSYDRPFKVATNWLKSSIPEIYIGDDSSGVFKLNSGTQFKTSDIPFGLELYPIFPAGEDALVIFNRIRVYIENGPDIQIFYKLIYKPRHGVEGIWDSDDTWYALRGSQIGDRVDWYFPTDARASGVKLKFVESGGDESFLIEKITLYYSEESNF